MIPLGLKIDVDTERGTVQGVPNLLRLFDEFNIRATFLFALGPDRTGRAIRRLFRPGFFKKVARTNVISIYGIRTLLNGVLLPGPHIAKKHSALMKSVDQAAHEVGIHCYDHIYWQDHLFKMKEPEVRAEVNRAVNSFKDVFGRAPKVMGAAGFQANELSLKAYDDQNLFYASDGRGQSVFMPKVGFKVYKTPQIPTTLPTLDELLGRPDFPLDKISNYLLSLIKPGQLNVLTIHAELEGMHYKKWFKDFLQLCLERKIYPCPIYHVAQPYLEERSSIPVHELIQGAVDGRSGTMAMQGDFIK